MKAPMREVVSVRMTTTRYNRRGEGSHVLTLTCGHELRRKTSEPIPNRAHCYECLYQALSDPAQGS